MQRLRQLLSAAGENRGKWTQGKKPSHYKRLSIPQKEADELAVIGQYLIMGYYGMECRLYYTQSLIAGAMLSRKYDTFIIVTPSQYGKSWLFGHVVAIMAYEGERLAVAAADGPKTDIIMTQTRRALAAAHDEVKEGLTAEGVKKVDRLDTSLSKARLSWTGGGYIEALTLGDTYDGKAHNKAVGRGSGYIIDEAALVSSQALAEIGRRELSRTDGKRELLAMVSNPHNPGAFYDALTQEHPDDKTLIIWMDALTAVQEERWTAEQILHSDFAKHKETRDCYLHCELPQQGSGMFDPVTVCETIPDGVHFLGVDSAYKGRDQIAVAHIVKDGGKLYVAEAVEVKKDNWKDGITNKDVAQTIARISHGVGAANICIDTGQGIWLVQELVGLGLPVKGIEFGAGATKERVKARHYAAVNAANKRAELHLDLQSLIESEAVFFSQSVADDLKEVWPLVTCERKSSGKIVVRPKIEISNAIGHSPDTLDAVLLGIHAAILYSAENYEYIT